MLNAIVDFSLRKRVYVLVGFILVLLLGVRSVENLPIDAVPDITNVQVIVNAKTGGLDPQQVEKSVTYFIEAEMAGIPHIREIRSLSRYGLSQTIVVFRDGTDIYWARQQIAERMRAATDKIPQGISLELAPITTGLGEVLMYVVLPKGDTPLSRRGEDERLVYLRTVQDFVLKPYLKSNIQGVAEIDSNGGYQKQIDIDVDPDKLEQYGVSLNSLIVKLRSLGENYGGGYIEQKQQQIIVRTNGLIALDKLKNFPIKLYYDGSHVRLRDIAHIRDFHPLRLGAATYQGQEAVLGTVLMLMGENSRAVALSAEQALKDAPLPNDVEIRVVYTRSFLVNATIKTVAKNLIEGAGLVLVIIFLFLGNLRAAFFVALAIPFSMAVALIAMQYLHISANLMSLGALDFGLIVDGSIVMIENIISHYEKRPPQSYAERFQIVKQSALDVLRPLLTGIIIIMAVYLPILTLEGTEGKMYYPMAITVLFALAGSLIIAVVVMPVLGLFVKIRAHATETVLFKMLYRIYEPILNFPLRNIRKLVLPTAAFIVICLALFFRIGSDFMPPLNEGDITLGVLHDAKASLTESIRREKQIEKILATFPEVETVFGRIGTSQAATDPMGVNLADCFVILKKDMQLWRKNARGKIISRSELSELMRTALAPVLSASEYLAESEILETQPIAMRFNEMLEGSRADISLRIYGKDLVELARLQQEIVRVLKTIPGAKEVELDALTALRKSVMLDAKINYDRINYLGIPLREVNDTVQTAMVGASVGSLYEDDWRFPIDVKIDEEKRNDPHHIMKIPVALPDGGTIRLGEVATFAHNENVTAIARSAMSRYTGVAIFLGARDTMSFVSDAQQKLKAELNIPPQFRLVWGGQFQNLQRAKARLLYIVPLILAAVFFLVYKTFNSFRQAVLIFSTIPFAWTGGILALKVAGIDFSVSAAVGFIALSGVAVLNGLVKVSYLNQLVREGHSIDEAVKLGALGRMRPVMMTALVASLGFLPMVLNTGIGAEVQRPLATVVLGGLITATLMTLLLLPAFYLWLEKGNMRRNTR